MSFKVNTEELLKSLQQAIRVVPSRSTLPILNCALFDFNNNRMRVSTTNLETSINIAIKINGEPFSTPFAIPIGRLLEITSNINDREIEFSLLDEKKLIIKTTTGSYTITGQDYSEFPSDPVMTESTSIGLSTKSFIEIINFTKNSVSKDELKPALQGVFFKISTDRILGVSTDGHRLSRIIIKQENDQPKGHEIIIPTKFLTLIKTDTDNTTQIELEVSKNFISLSQKNTIIFSRIIKDDYPDYEKVIPLDNEKSAIVNKNELISALKRVSIFSNRSTKQITFIFNKKELTLLTQDSEKAAEGIEKIKCDFSTEEELKIGFNATFFQEALNNLNSSSVNMFLNGPLSAAILTEQEQKEKTDKLLLLMPIRLND